MEPSRWNLCKRHRLRRLLSHGGTTLRDVAQKAGIDPATMSGYLNGNISISLERMDLLCQTVGIDPGLLDTPVLVDVDRQLMTAIQSGGMQMIDGRWMIGSKTISAKYLAGLLDEGFVQVDAEGQMILTEVGTQALESPEAMRPPEQQQVRPLPQRSMT